MRQHALDLEIDSEGIDSYSTGSALAQQVGAAELDTFDDQVQGSIQDLLAKEKEYESFASSPARVCLPSSTIEHGEKLTAADYQLIHNTPSSVDEKLSWRPASLKKSAVELALWAYLSDSSAVTIDRVCSSYLEHCFGGDEMGAFPSSEIVTATWEIWDSIERYAPTQGSSFLAIFGCSVFEFGILAPSRVMNIIDLHQSCLASSEEQPELAAQPGPMEEFWASMTLEESKKQLREEANQFYVEARDALVAEEWYKYLAWNTIHPDNTLTQRKLEQRRGETSRESAMTSLQLLRHAYGRWEGHLFHYMYADTSDNKLQCKKATPVLLVHGFGAFADHFEDCLLDLTSCGHIAFAPTIPGFGRSAKPSLHYTLDSYMSFLQNFRRHITTLHEEPSKDTNRSILVGNSVGAYLAGHFAAKYPHEVEDLILINSAGLVSTEPLPLSEEFGTLLKKASVNEGESKLLPAKLSKKVAKTMLSFGKAIAAPTLKALYPARPERCDGWFSDELLRAASDPGAWRLFQALLYLDGPPTIDENVKKYGGRTLMIQVCCPSAKET